MRIFVSYSRKDDAAIDGLTRDLERLDHQVWRDHELSGGQAWWDTILARIRECELFAVGLSPDSVMSEACRREAEYALALGKPILPVRVHSQVSLALLPAFLAESQWVDYTTRDLNTGLELARALSRLHPAGPLPPVLPPPPEVPISYLTALKDEIDGAAPLSFEQQTALVAKLRLRLGDPDEQRDVLVLLARLRNRPDLLATVARDVDELLAYGAGRTASASGTAATGPSSSRWSWHQTGPTNTGPSTSGVRPSSAEPWRMSNGASNGSGSVLPTGMGHPRTQPDFVGRVPPGPDGPWPTATFVVLIIGSLLCVPVGVLAGALGWRVPARRNQAIVLFIVSGLTLLVGIAIAIAGQQSPSSSSGF